MKIKCFNWLMMENRIMTWDNIVKRDGIGLNFYNLCKIEAKSMTHLMVQCSFSKQVWKDVLSAFNIPRIWDVDSLET